YRVSGSVELQEKEVVSLRSPCAEQPGTEVDRRNQAARDENASIGTDREVRHERVGEALAPEKIPLRVELRDEHPASRKRAVAEIESLWDHADDQVIFCAVECDLRLPSTTGQQEGFEFFAPKERSGPVEHGEKGVVRLRIEPIRPQIQRALVAAHR